MFEARSGAELSMVAGQTLLVEQLPDGSWPPAEKWMQGYNEVTSESGEFPGGAYVELIEEFQVQPKPRSPSPPEVEHYNQVPPLPPQPSPRHFSQQGFRLPGMSGLPPRPGQHDNELTNRNHTGTVAREEEEEAPPPPPRRSIPGRGSENQISSTRMSLPHIPPQAPPKPAPRSKSRSSVGSREAAVSPIHGAHREEDGHRWSRVTFSIPMQCAGCEFPIPPCHSCILQCSAHNKGGEN